MPLDIKIEGDSAGLRATSHWLRTMQQSVHDVGSDVHGARSDSEWGWRGEAGSAFRGSMGRAGTAVDGLAVDFGATARALDTHADDLDTVSARMNQAVDIAHEGGLRTTGDTIFEPGPAPAEPAALPTTRVATAAERSAHAQSTAAQGAYLRQVVAYQQAGQVVVAARGIETAPQRVLNNFLSGFVDKLPFTITDFATGLAGAAATRTSTLRARADRFDTKAARAARLLDSDNLSHWNRIRAAVLHAENVVDARAARAQATVGMLARQVDRLPPWVKNGVSANVDFHGKITPRNAGAGQGAASTAPGTVRGNRHHGGGNWLRHRSRQECRAVHCVRGQQPRRWRRRRRRIRRTRWGGRRWSRGGWGRFRG